MAFVNERIPEEEKEKFGFEVFTYPNGKKPTLSRWTIDREREVFLVLVNVLGGGASGTKPTDHYVLSWKGLHVKFEGECDVSGDIETKYSLKWRVRNVDTPSDNDEKKAAIYKWIEEALDAKGLSYARHIVSDVKVIFE